MNPKHVMFQGFKHFVSGNASLQLDDGILNVTGIHRMNDGLCINMENARQWWLYMQPLNVYSHTVLGMTFSQTNHNMGKQALSQWLIMQSPDGRYAYLLVNGELEPGNARIIGLYKGEVMFEGTYPAQSHIPNWRIAVVFHLEDQNLTLSKTGFFIEEQENTIIKILGLQGWVKHGDTDNLLFIDQLHIVSDAYQGANDKHINQVIISGEELHAFSIISEQSFCN